VQTCSPGTAGSCPANFFCNYDSVNQRYVCCGTGTPSASNPCAPNSGQAYLNPSTQQPQTCTLGTGQTGCPAGYGCAYSYSLRNYYCCSGAITRPGTTAPAAQCPAPQIAALTTAGQPQTCVVGLNTCPAGYICTRTTSSVGLCCGRGGTTTGGGITSSDPYGCSVGNAFLYPGTRTPLQCSLNGPACPAGYSCRRSVRANALQCCSNVAGVGFRDPIKQARPQAFDAFLHQGRRTCTANQDCRDRYGRTTMCMRGYCL